MEKKNRRLSSRERHSTRLHGDVSLRHSRANMEPQEISAAILLLFPLLLFDVGFSESNESCAFDAKAIDPCGHENVLTVSHGSCDDVLISETLADPQDGPTVKMEHAEPGKKYILFLLDPDFGVWSNNSDRYAYHVNWIVYDIEAIDFADGDIAGTLANPYNYPFNLGGAHRYQFFVFEQPEGYTMEKQPEMMFDFQQFIVDKGLCSNLIGAFQYNVYSLQFTITNTLSGTKPLGPRKKGHAEKSRVLDRLLIFCLALLHVGFDSR